MDRDSCWPLKEAGEEWKERRSHTYIKMPTVRQLLCSHSCNEKLCDPSFYLKARHLMEELRRAEMPSEWPELSDLQILHQRYLADRVPWTLLALQ